ncbi:hypothetical protein [Piscirickettsia litoralis]|uniref:Transposase n=1 Tax=Piscirickettsia litoralis TaxID=1891921 RepID=A0ABX2ZXN7_9GAMM|nr:hypothetical protein [Piscirickettsia litoralis]ODN41366.1 hypothetical protein BGC07_16480 [Piscirickettsia litoralis]
MNTIDGLPYGYVFLMSHTGMWREKGFNVNQFGQVKQQNQQAMAQHQKRPEWSEGKRFRA